MGIATTMSTAATILATLTLAAQATELRLKAYDCDHMKGKITYIDLTEVEGCKEATEDNITSINTMLQVIQLKAYNDIDIYTCKTVVKHRIEHCGT